MTILVGGWEGSLSTVLVVYQKVVVAKVLA